MAQENDKKSFWESLTRSSQAFILALIIISSYVVFFAWIIFSAPQLLNDKQTVIGVNYEGMKDLTATFGIIAAAVVGYYFGQRNSDQATKMAIEAKKDADDKKVEAIQAKKDADEKKVEAKSEKIKMAEEIRRADPLYEKLEKITNTTEKDKRVGEVAKDKVNMDLDKLNEEIKERRAYLKNILQTKEKEINEPHSGP